jgi:branched-chain amino acid transport system substrate-binding protein
VAQQLIASNQVDMLLTTSTPEVVVPVSSAAEAAGVPCVSTVVPWEAWVLGLGGKLSAMGVPTSAPFKWVYHFSFGVPDFAACYLDLWSQIPNNKKVGVMWPNDDDGNAIRAALGPVLHGAGYTIVDPGAYQDGTNDYTPQITQFKQQNCQIFNTFPIPPDFTTFWRQAAQQGYTKMVKIAQIAKACLFPDDVTALGNLGYNLSSAAYWHKAFPYKSTLTGVGGDELADGYEKASGKQWTQQLGASLAVFDAGFAALKASGDPATKAMVAKALSTLNVTTINGKVDFTSGPVPNVSPGPIIGTQWVKAPPGSRFKLDYPVTEHATDPNVPISAKLKPYNG